MPRQVHTLEHLQHSLDHCLIRPIQHQHVAEGGRSGLVAGSVEGNASVEEEHVRVPDHLVVKPSVVGLGLEEQEDRLALSRLP